MSLVDKVRAAAKQVQSSASSDIRAQVSTLTSGYLNPGRLKDLVDGRIAKLQAAFLLGNVQKTSEASLVKALNKLVEAIGMPEYGRTSPLELRVFRLEMLRHIPELNPKALTEPDEFDIFNGKYVGRIFASMTPVEVAYLVCSLLLQKRINPQFQRTPSEFENEFTAYERDLPAHEAVNTSVAEPEKRTIGVLNNNARRSTALNQALREWRRQIRTEEQVVSWLDSFQKELGL